MSFAQEAREKLQREANAGKFNSKENAMKTAVVEALTEFAEQSEKFAEAIAHGGSFEECMKAVAKGVGSSISDLDAYKKAVKFYMPGADVRFQMVIEICEGPKKPNDPAVIHQTAEIIDLTAWV